MPFLHSDCGRAIDDELRACNHPNRLYTLHNRLAHISAWGLACLRLGHRPEFPLHESNRPPVRWAHEMPDEIQDWGQLSALALQIMSVCLRRLVGQTRWHGPW